ncbi:MAG: hypothetical protein ACOCRO_01025 [Halanaerobiales bacterium]
MISIFYILKEKGISLEEALEYVEQFQSEKSKIYLYNRNMATVSNIEIIEKLYNGELKLLSVGEFQFK